MAPGLDEFDVLLEVVLSLVRVPKPREEGSKAYVKQLATQK